MASSNCIPFLIEQMCAYLRSIQHFMSENFLVLNVSKCEAMLVRDSETLIQPRYKIYKINDNIDIRVGDERIVVKDRIKYLGVILDKRLSTLPQVDAALHAAKVAQAQLKFVFANKHIPSHTKIILYKQLIRPLLTYGFAGWCWVSANQMRKLRTCERALLYRCL